jgi:hypothetical protein
MTDDVTALGRLDSARIPPHNTGAGRTVPYRHAKRHDLRRVVQLLCVREGLADKAPLLRALRDVPPAPQAELRHCPGHQQRSQRADERLGAPPPVEQGCNRAATMGMILSFFEVAAAAAAGRGCTPVHERQQQTVYPCRVVLATVDRANMMRSKILSAISGWVPQKAKQWVWTEARPTHNRSSSVLTRAARHWRNWKASRTAVHVKHERETHRRTLSHSPTQHTVTATGAGEDNMIINDQVRLRSPCIPTVLRSHYLHPHPYQSSRACPPPNGHIASTYLPPEPGQEGTVGPSRLGKVDVALTCTATSSSVSPPLYITLHCILYCCNKKHFGLAAQRLIRQATYGPALLLPATVLWHSPVAACSRCAGDSSDSSAATGPEPFRLIKTTRDAALAVSITTCAAYM